MNIGHFGLERGDGVGEPVAIEFLDAALVGEGGELRVDGHLGEQRETALFRGLRALALAEEVDPPPAVGAGEIAHVLHKADDGHRHLLRHLHGLLHHHADKLLRGGDDHDAGERDGLKDAQRHVAGARRHIDEEVVDVPENVGPELGDHAADDGAAPDDGVSLVLQQQVHAHHVDACAVAGSGAETAPYEQAVSLIGKAWRLTAEETSEQLALIEQEKAVMGRIENGESAEHIRQELLLNWSGLESIEVLEDLFETSTLLETAPERRSLFDMAMLLIETQNLLDWIEKTDAEKEELIQNFT